MEEYQRVFEVKSSLKSYEIIELNGLEFLNTNLSNYDLVIADYELKSYFANINKKVYYFTCNETTKSWDKLSNFIDLFLNEKITKKSKILVLGGGVIQDAVSFVCSIFNRGVSFDFIPTTVLSMVDSCIGGKTSINYSNFKNKLGNFYPPDKIFIVSDFIKTLPPLEILSGLGEVFKFQILQFKIKNLDFVQNNNFILDNNLIFDCLKYKASIIELDEFDTGERLKLNYGHTFGHAIESIAKFKVPHGIGVVLGIVIANEIASKIGLISANLKLAIEENSYHFLNQLRWDRKWFNFSELLSLIKMDKKNNDFIRMILLDEKSRDFILKVVEPEIIESSFIEIINRLNFKYENS